MANKIKNKFTFPKSTEFTPKDLVIDVKNGHLYYKSNFAVFKVQGTIFSTNIAGLTTDLSIGTADDTQVLFNNASTIDGLGNFTISNIDGSGNGTVNIGIVEINGGNINGTAIGSVSPSSGTFTSLTTDDADINGGNIDDTSIGSATPSTGAFTKVITGNSALTGQQVGNVNNLTTPSGIDMVITTDNFNYSSPSIAGAIKIRKASNTTQPMTRIKGGLYVESNGGGGNPGNIKAQEDVVAYASDERLKENIINISNPLQKIKQLRGVYFDWKDKTKDLGFYPTTKKNEIGMIAQEVEKIIPQAITTAPFDESYEGNDRENYKTIKYDRIIPLLVECINEQQKQIDNLKNQIEQWHK